MKPHPRIRRTIKWGGAVASVLLLLVWMGSGWWELHGVSIGATEVFLGRGMVNTRWVVWNATMRDQLIDELNVTRDVPLATRSIYHREFDLGWWPCYASRGRTIRYLSIPLWPVVLTSLGSALVSWRLDTLARRREKLHLCPTCRYDRTGLAPGAVCPECGAAPSKG